MIILASADVEKTRAFMQWLVARFEEYVNEVAKEEVDYVDAFMAVHNFHKAIVFDLADRCEMEGEGRKRFLQTAAATFAKAMEEGK